MGKPWAAHECDLRQVLQDGISVGYLQLGLRLFHSNPKSSNKITVMDWMLHRIDALLIHVFYIFKVYKRTPSTGTSDLPLPRWVDVLKFLISTYRCDFRQCLSLRVQFVVSALQSSSAGFRLDRIYLTVCQFFRCSNMFNMLLAAEALWKHQFTSGASGVGTWPKRVRGMAFHPFGAPWDVYELQCESIRNRLETGKPIDKCTV